MKSGGSGASSTTIGFSTCSVTLTTSGLELVCACLTVFEKTDGSEASGWVKEGFGVAESDDESVESCFKGVVVDPNNWVRLDVAEEDEEPSTG